MKADMQAYARAVITKQNKRERNPSGVFDSTVSLRVEN